MREKSMETASAQNAPGMFWLQLEKNQKPETGYGRVQRKITG